MQLYDRTPEEFGRILKQHRQDWGFTVDQAADFFGIRPRTWNGVEQGRKFRFQRILMMAVVAFNEQYINLWNEEIGSKK